MRIRRDSLSPSTGPLDGRTVLRFAHAYDSNGGTERYLDDLDHALLGRSAMTVIRLYLTRSAVPLPPEERSVGRGKLILVRLPVIPEASRGIPPAETSLTHRLKQKIRDWVLYNPLTWNTVGAKWAVGRRLPRQAGQAMGAGEAAAAFMRSGRIDLVMLHFFGGLDADEILMQARAHRVPVAVLNHYSNDRFLHLAIRKHALLATAVSGVNGLQLPGYVRKGFTNLSDGIDTDLFRSANARPVRHGLTGPIILLPARVVPEKGQLDLVRAAIQLRREGIPFNLVFAGGPEKSEFVTELRAAVARAGLTEHTLFLGAVSVETLRDWYAISTVVAFPTYHHEGLGRVIVEAQAMGIPVIAYGTGGVPDAIVHRATGLLVRTGDLASLTAGIRELLTSDALRAQLAAAGRQAAETQFSLEALAKRHEDFYLRVVSPA